MSSPATPMPSLDDLIAEETEVQLARFDNAVAVDLGGRIQRRGLAESLPIAVEITKGPDVVFFAMLPGASANNARWARRKRATVQMFQRSSLHAQLRAEQQGTDFNARYALPAEDYAASGGGVPIFVRGSGFVGTATVSGLPAVEDHRLVIAALREIMAEQG
ncbi:heme-degrading domain-containing protein [uncultured Alsobacter sp.]|uniref:heme-degrading domain-containing protein n=1 Tax=uncultured Alsobacter sp. TaxID=1748258 RepID=UPI0025FC3E25|nr:heme-degrading domain-containing protein [uncultured Alsobacter sp.]